MPSHSKTNKPKIYQDGNFFCHGQSYRFSKKSLFIFDMDSPLRKKLVWFVTHPYFDYFILLIILFNTILLATTDYTCVDKSNTPVYRGYDPNHPDVVKTSYANYLIDKTDLFFTVIFTIESVFKIVAMGFIFEKGCYLRDGWNWIDFIVVVSGLLQSVPGFPKISILRTIRVLRPLKSLKAVPRMKLLVQTLFEAIPDLLNVLALLAFIFCIFGILSIQFWQGLLHYRCRLTDAPVQVSWEEFANYTRNELLYFQMGKPVSHPVHDIIYNRSSHPICRDDEGNEIPLSNPKWNQETSLWRNKRVCVWPADNDQMFYCTTPGGGGRKVCQSGTVCGSNFDDYGNPRFIDDPDHYQLAPQYSSDLSWGMANFDNILSSFLVILEAITIEGWTDAMYDIMDTSNPIFAAVYFVILVLFGSYFFLNLMLAVIWAKFEEGQSELIEERKEMRSFLREKRIKKRQSLNRLKTNRKNCFRKLLYDISISPYLNIFIVICILINAITLALDRYPPDYDLQHKLEIINFVLTLIFTMEMLIKVFGLGLRLYLNDNFNIFDMVIVTISLIELGISPPYFMTGVERTGGGISALRTFRLFRLFKLARSWTSLQEILATLVDSLGDIANFSVLLFLYIYIMVLVGMQFFANQMHFDPLTTRSVPFNDPQYPDAMIPRWNFDNFLWAFVTVFQFLSVENWNQVMFDARRGVGDLASLYFVFCIVIGNFVLLNLFMAILLGNFESGGDHGSLSSSSMQSTMSSMGKILDLVSQWGHQLSCCCKKSVPVDPNPISHDSLPRNLLGGGSYHSMATLVPSSSFRVKQTRSDLPASMASPSSVISVPASNTGVLERPKILSATDHKSNEKAQSAAILMRNVLLRQKHDQEGSPGTPAAPGTAVSDNARILEKRKSRMSFRSQNSGQSQMSEETSGLYSMDPDMQAVYEEDVIPVEGKALFLMTPDNRFRSFIARVVQHRAFDNVILVLILISSITLAVDSPLGNPNTTGATALKVIDYTMTVLFTLEFLMKVVTYGFLIGPNTYLHNPWNILDILIVILSIVSMGMELNPNVSNSNLGAIRSLRTLRAFRPLRMISRNPGLRLVINALLGSIPAVLNILLVCVLFFLIFAIFGVTYFKGLFHACQGDVFDRLTEAQVTLITYPTLYISPPTVSAIVVLLNPDQQMWASGSYVGTTSKAVCLWLGAEWLPTVPENFDDVLKGLSCLYEISTTEGWLNVMWAGVDGTKPDMQPITNNQPYWAFFFVAFIVVGNFFVLNLFVGVVIDNFNRIKQEMGDHIFLTDAQREWVQMQESMLAMKQIRPVKKPDNYFRRKMFEFVTSTAFESVIMIMIILNTVLMATRFYGEPHLYSVALDIMNYIFSGIFTLEAILKIIAHGASYFCDGWNLFDFLVVIGTDIGIILSMVGINSVSAIAVIRTFRIGRVLRLIRSAKSLRSLFNTLIITLPSLGNVAGILLLFFFIYAIMGNQLFAKVKFGEHLTYRANFRTFFDSLLTLMRCATGEAWNYIMYSLRSLTPHRYDVLVSTECVGDPQYSSEMCGFHDFEGCIPLNGCGNAISYLYFYSFTLIITFVMMNLFIGVILDGFSVQSAKEDAKLTQDQFAEFINEWSEVDKEAKGYIDHEQLDELFSNLHPPMGFNKKHLGGQALRKKIAAMNIPMFKAGEELRVYFNDVAIACARRILKDSLKRRGEENINFDLPEEHQVVKAWKKRFRDIKNVTANTIQYTANHYYSVLTLTTAFHIYKFRSQFGAKRSAERKKSVSEGRDSITGLKAVGAGFSRSTSRTFRSPMESMIHAPLTTFGDATQALARASADTTATAPVPTIYSMEQNEHDSEMSNAEADMLRFSRKSSTS